MEDKILLTRNGKSFITYLKKDINKIAKAKEYGFREPTEKELENYLDKVGLTKQIKKDEAKETKETKAKEVDQK